MRNGYRVTCSRFQRVKMNQAEAHPASPNPKAALRDQSRSSSSGFASDAIAISIKVMGIQWEDAEIPVCDVRTIRIRGRRRDADVRIRRVAVVSRRRGRR